MHTIFRLVVVCASLLTYASVSAACVPVELSRLDLKQANPWAVQVSPTGRCIAIAHTGFGLTLQGLNPSDGLLIRSLQNTFKIKDGCAGLAFSPDGTCLIAAGKDKLFVFHVDDITCTLTQKQKIRLQANSQPYMVAFNPDGRTVAVSLHNANKLAIFTVDAASNTLSTKPLQTVKSSGEKPFCLAYSPSGTTLACCNFYSNTIDLFQVEKATGKIAHKATLSSEGQSPEEIVFSPLGTGFVVSHAGSLDNKFTGTVSVFAFDEQSLSVSCVQDHVSAGSFAVGAAYSQNGDYLFVTSSLSAKLFSYLVSYQSERLCKDQHIDLQSQPVRLARFRDWLVLIEDGDVPAVRCYSIKEFSQNNGF